MRLDKFLANSGIGTRTEVKKIIKSKLVKVGNEIVTNPSFEVLDLDVFVNNKKIEYKPYVYIMLNKPSGVISATEDKKYKTVIDLLKGEYRTYSLFPIGRLDIDTTGLIILTNDGKLSHELLSPKKHIPKTYYVKTKYDIIDLQINLIEKGVDIGGYVTKNDTKLELIDNNSCYLTITEGKFHQVKKMFLAVNNEVILLKRVKMNNLELDENLDLSEFRELTIDELKLLKGV